MAEAKRSNTRTLELLIDGKWRAAEDGATIPVINPATEETVALVPRATLSDLDEAAVAAEHGFDKWRRFPAAQRGSVLQSAAHALRERATDIGRLITEENGKTLAEGQAEVNFAADYFSWFAEEARRTYGRVIPQKVAGTRQYVLREPVGPVLALSPWNWPLVTASRKVAPALAAGCSVILKPAEEAPSAAIAMAAILIEVGLPSGALNVVNGDPPTISQHLIAHPSIRKVSFTGSVEVGRLLGSLAGQHLKRITLELGGHAPVIICEDADLKHAVDLIVPMKFRTAGQVCSSPSRFYVAKGVHDEFVQLITHATQAIQTGNGFDPTSSMGPLSSKRRLIAVQRLVDDAINRGARLVTGGSRVGETGYFFAPTVLDEVPDDAQIMHEEPFGPLIAVSQYDGIEDAITHANSLNVGLSSYVFTRSLNLAHRLSEEIQAGMVGVNSMAVGIAEAPFGGIRDSGNGQEGGLEGMTPYLVDKFVVEAVSG